MRWKGNPLRAGSRPVSELAGSASRPVKSSILDPLIWCDVPLEPPGAASKPATNATRSLSCAQADDVPCTVPYDIYGTAYGRSETPAGPTLMPGAGTARRSVRVGPRRTLTGAPSSDGEPGGGDTVRA